MSDGGIGQQPRKHVTVVGAGIVGVCSTLWLQRAGWSVTLVDSKGPGDSASASSGNPGLISPGQVVPYAVPGVWRDIVRWLLDPEGPVVVRPTYLPKLAPWLWRWIKASRLEEALRVSRVMRGLHGGTFDAYGVLTRNTAAASLLEQCGHLYLSERPGKAQGSELVGFMREAAGVRVVHLNMDEIRELEPCLAPIFHSGLLIPGNGRCRDPQRFVEILADEARKAGAKLIQGTVRGFKLGNGKCEAIILETGAEPVDQLVIAAGAGSANLTAKLGTRVPLQVERGYHVTISNPGVVPIRQIVVRDWAIGVGAMDMAVRIGGTVEYTGLESKPNWRRAKVLIGRAKRLFPGIRTDRVSEWAGDRPTMADGLPVLGRSPHFPNVYFAFGNGHHGMTAGPTMGKILAEIVSGVEPSIDIAPLRANRF